MEKLLKTYYNIPTADKNIIFNAIKRHKKEKNILSVINLGVIGALLFLFLEIMINVNIDFFSFFMNLYFSFGLISMFLADIAFSIILFVENYYFCGIVISLFIVGINLIHIEKNRI